MNTAVATGIAGLLVAAQKNMDTYCAIYLPNMAIPQLELSTGPKYAKIINKSGFSSRSAWAFVDLKTGDILKPASWAKPAKHARGSVLAPDYGISCCSVYGPRYLR